jgi:hypothetical protein
MAPSDVPSLFAPDDAKRFLDILDRAIPASIPAPPEEKKPAEIVVDKNKKEAKINTSEVKYKTVDEVYASPTQDIVYQADV